METLRRVKISRIQAVPPFMLNKQLPSNFAVPEPICLSFFLEFVEDLLILEPANASKRFEEASLWEIVSMLAGALDVDDY